jgi:2-polyprenyl-3-methyl-5-hydroxy-6-metoxy-1,4-benzoquinol methylase
MTTQVIDEAKVEAFVGKVLTDVSATTVAVLAAIGDRLGLWKDLASSGPATSDELAARTGIDARYAKEWTGAMTTAGYLEHADGVFTLPAEHIPALAQETGPVFFGGCLEMLTGMLAVIDPLTEAFRTGGGVSQDAYPRHTYDGMDRFTAGWHENLLLQVWIPAVPDVQSALERGIDVADVGCGRGRAITKLAQAFPNSRFVGYDIFEPNVEAAKKIAADAGVSDRVRFETRDVSKGLPESYDLITTFDVVHDAADPRGLVRVIREALKPDGTYLCLDINCSEHLDENVGPLGALFHGFSLLYCMTTSLAQGGEALGTVGLHPHKLEEIAQEAGFGTCRTLPLENPFNNLYELKA